MENEVNGRIRLNLEDIISKAIYLNKKRDRRIIIIGGSEEESHLLYTGIKENNLEITVDVKEKEYEHKSGDYVIYLGEIELFY